MLLILTSTGLNIAQYVQQKKTAEIVENQAVTIENLEKVIDSHEQTIASQKGTIASQKSAINTYKSTNESLKTKSGYFDTICNEFRYSNSGYAASNFRANQSVIVLSKSDKNKKFTLTANWTNGGTVTVKYSGYSATLSFDKNSWTTSTEMTVTPWSEGITIATFSNSVNSKTFKILIIVTK